MRRNLCIHSAMKKQLVLCVALLLVCHVTAKPGDSNKKSMEQVSTELNHKLVHLQKRVAGGSSDPSLDKFYKDIDVAVEKLKRTGRLY
ncbi:hypothetical protein B566_EDAN005523 [Ephemera danica]|nr:hypothetical protein B566_EDAN005523 [Ephemera danica]